MKKTTKIAIGAGVVGLSGISIFAILRQRKLAKQAFDAAEFGGDDDEIMVENDVDEAEAEAAEEEQDSGDKAEAAELSDDADDALDAEIEADDDEIMVENDVDEAEAAELSSEEEQEAVEEAVDETETVEETVDETEAEADELSSEEAVLIYPPINECPYKSREVWAARIDDCIGLLYNQIMMTTKKINWERIENELVDKYLKFSQDDFGVTGYEERYIRSKIMKINREHYENVIDTIDSVIDDIFNTNIENKYIVDGHINNKMIRNDVMFKCCEDGVIREWQWPSVCAHLENNVNTTCEYIEACMAKRQPQ